ncbi:Uncharacterised protein [Clostridium perfringens]|nr:Uncharacterised protein [Clostridium perfringens]
MNTRRTKTTTIKSFILTMRNVNAIETGIIISPVFVLY